MKLQAALDTLTLDECLELLEETKGYIDIAEVGTPLLLKRAWFQFELLKKNLIVLRF